MASLVNRRSLVWALVLVPLLSYLGGRIRILSLGYYNAPGRMPLHSNFSSYEIKFQDKIRNCEDVLLLKNRPVALLACDPGRDNWNTVMGDFPEDAEIDPNAGLYAYNYQQPGDKALFRFKILGYDDELRTIGVEFHEPSSTLLATNHLRQGGPRIEQFRLDFNAMTATHIRTISHPLINTPNAIAASSADEFFVTNQHLFVPAKNRLLWLLETYLAPPLGRVVHVCILPSGEIDAAVSVRQAYPNGITFFGEDESRVAVASSNKALVYIYKVLKRGKNTHPSLELENTIRNLPYMPDNVGTSTDGALIIAGHPNLRKLGQFASSRKFCHRPETLAKATQATKELCRNLQGASWVSEWSEKDGLSHIYSGWEYPTSATAVHDRARGVGIIAGLYAQGIFVWRD